MLYFLRARMRGLEAICVSVAALSSERRGREMTVSLTSGKTWLSSQAPNCVHAVCFCSSWMCLCETGRYGGRETDVEKTLKIHERHLYHLFVCFCAGMTIVKCCTIPLSAWFREDDDWDPFASWRLCRWAHICHVVNALFCIFYFPIFSVFFSFSFYFLCFSSFIVFLLSPFPSVQFHSFLPSFQTFSFHTFQYPFLLNLFYSLFPHVHLSVVIFIDLFPPSSYSNLNPSKFKVPSKNVSSFLPSLILYLLPFFYPIFYT